jgi:hypothetical protein
MKLLSISFATILFASTVSSLTYQKVDYERHELPLYVNFVRSLLGNGENILKLWSIKNKQFSYKKEKMMDKIKPEHVSYDDKRPKENSINFIELIKKSCVNQYVKGRLVYGCSIPLTIRAE